MSKSLTREELSQFIGDLERFVHPLANKVIYTPGVQHVAERGGAYWLIDEIALALTYDQSARSAIAKDERLQSLHFWRLDVHEDKSATLTARADSGDTPFYTKQIPWTDFPLDGIDIWAGSDGRVWTLYLPSEH